ncbi:MAG TPA: phenylalanine--tRNA ligase subunit beta [Nitrososphaeraceae archaeon]
MPVVNLDLNRLGKWFPGRSIQQLIDALPFIALDIESISDNEIRIEYNPNRPDFSSDYGIARALRGYLGIETGAPKINLVRTNRYKILSDEPKDLSRPIIRGLVVKGLKLDAQAIKQLSSIQDDLHEGIGRRKIKSSIGIYPLNDIKFPLRYTSISNNLTFTFVKKSLPTIVSDLINHDIAIKYRQSHRNYDNKYSALLDNENKLISVPPLVSYGTETLESGERELFIEVTSVDRKLAEDMIAILAALVHDMGSKLKTIVIETPRSITYSPSLELSNIMVTVDHVNYTLGTKLSSEEIITSLRKSRLDARAVKNNKSTIKCTIPRYRVDIFDKTDIVEEVAIGYGIKNLIPSIPSSNLSGNVNKVSRYFNVIRIIMVGLGFLEVNNFSLIDRKIQFDFMGDKCEPDKSLTVEGAQNADLDILRNSLLPSLMLNLSRNVHEAYPQKIFEIAKVYNNETVLEQWHLAVLLAYSGANFTDAKSVLQGFLSTSFGSDMTTEPVTSSHFNEGRCAKIVIASDQIGELGEFTSHVIDCFRLRVPVSGFEINLSKMLNIES